MTEARDEEREHLETADQVGHLTRLQQGHVRCKCFLICTGQYLYIDDYSMVLYNTSKCAMEVNINIQHNTLY